MTAVEIEELILKTFPDAKIIIDDLRGDGDHYAAQIISEKFRGKTRVQQHQMVYNAILLTEEMYSNSASWYIK